jgi:hypothetical protein
MKNQPKVNCYKIGPDHSVIVTSREDGKFDAAFFYCMNPNCLGTKVVSYHSEALDILAGIIEGKEVL